MSTPKPSVRFEDTPLRTPELVAADPQAALSVRPAWLHAALLVYPEGHENDPARFSPAVTLVFGKKHVASRSYSPLQVAFLLELSRFGGISIVTNSDGKGRWYERITITGQREDLTSVNRVFSGATEYVEAKVAGIKSDMRAENLKHGPAGRLSKDARHVVLGHAGRIAKRLEAEGRMPPHITALDYLTNLICLLHLIDKEAQGKELLDLIATIIKPGRGPVEAGREV